MKKERVIKRIYRLQNYLGPEILDTNLYTINYGEQSDHINTSDALEETEKIIRRSNEIS